MTLKALLQSIIPSRLRPIGYLTWLVQERTGSKVLNGPFKGMKYLNDSVGSAYIPKLLGIYEEEIIPALERLLAYAPMRIIDIGAAEGYYAVGVALRCPEAEVLAFEADARGQERVKKMAALNDVSRRVVVHGFCSPEALTDALAEGGRTAVICDCEGYEEQLLDLNRVPHLASALILVELHDFIIPGITDELCSRFQNTHQMTLVRSKTRGVARFPYSTWYTRLLPTSYLRWSVSEWRPTEMTWLLLEPLIPRQS